MLCVVLHLRSRSGRKEEKLARKEEDSKKLKFVKTSENPLTCWHCMIVNVDA
jgi:hypothetical protein